MKNLTRYMRNIFQNAFYNFQKTRKKETTHTRKLRILQKICQSVECEILNKIA